MIKRYHLDKVKWIADGGDTFQDSVMRGINNLKNKISLDDYVMVQYGAAPFTSDKIVNDVIRVMKDKGSAVTATPFSYLLSVYERAEEQGLIEKIEPHTTSLMYALGDMLY